jgi:hypothetical protein
VRRPANLSLGGQTENDDFCNADDEYCHSHSAYLREAAKASEKQAHESALLQEFVNFVQSEDPNVLPILEALLATETQGDAANRLRITQREFGRMLRRLRQLGKCFLSGEPVPRQRIPYKTRIPKTKQVLGSRIAA